ncbi:alpha/beta hydrolase [Motiliproteus sp. MSK22-1]|uniref:alpha/beta hydrolase n=1 Tax=Motiliproteus sp. MSK22-1 TaxID=1897630 RepID=UPI001300CDAF|nr:alpha/beta hydrolase [Motiliproteus sp. MSK22-1]
MSSLKHTLEPWSHEEEGICLRGWMTPDCGRNDRPVIHFLHGTGLSNLTYWPFLQHFEKDYDLFLNSIEGHGDSDTGSRRNSHEWNRLADRCFRAYQSQRANWGSVPVIGMGHSLGAILTLLMQERSVIQDKSVLQDEATVLKRPARHFDQYILLDPVIYPKPLIATMRMLSGLRMSKHVPVVRKAHQRRHQWPSRDAALDNLRGRGAFKNWSEESLVAYIDHGLCASTDGSWQLRCSPWLEARLFAGYPKKLWSAITRLPQGTEIIHSEDTYSFIPPTVRKAEKANPNIHLSVSDGGHCFMQEFPKRSYQQVVDLIRF